MNLDTRLQVPTKLTPVKMPEPKKSSGKRAKATATTGEAVSSVNTRTNGHHPNGSAKKAPTNGNRVNGKKLADTSENDVGLLGLKNLIDEMFSKDMAYQKENALEAFTRREKFRITLKNILNQLPLTNGVNYNGDSQSSSTLDLKSGITVPSHTINLCNHQVKPQSNFPGTINYVVLDNSSTIDNLTMYYGDGTTVKYFGPKEIIVLKKNGKRIYIEPKETAPRTPGPDDPEYLFDTTKLERINSTPKDGGAEDGYPDQSDRINFNETDLEYVLASTLGAGEDISFRIDS